MFKAKISGKEYAVEPVDSGYLVYGKEVKTDIIETGKGRFHVLKDHQSYSAEIVSFDKDSKTVVIRINSNTYTVDVKDRYDELLRQMGIDGGAGKKVNDIKAPMPGMVLNVMVESGQEIKKGDALVVLEAMKMENILKSPADGIVRKILVTKGDKVEKNQVMVNLD